MNLAAFAYWRGLVPLEPLGLLEPGVFLGVEDESEFEPGVVPPVEEPGIVRLLDPPIEPGVDPPGDPDPICELPAAPLPMVELPLRAGLTSVLEPLCRTCIASVRFNDSTIASRRATRASSEFVLVPEE